MSARACRVPAESRSQAATKFLGVPGGTLPAGSAAATIQTSDAFDVVFTGTGVNATVPSPFFSDGLSGVTPATAGRVHDVSPLPGSFAHSMPAETNGRLGKLVL